MTEASYLDMAPCGYFSFDEQGLILEANDTVCRLLGYTKEEFIGRQLESILTLPSRIFFQTHFFPLLQIQGSAEEIFMSLLSKDNQHLPALINSKKQVSGEAVHYRCAFITVHHRKKFEDELLAAKNKAEKALQENTELLKIKSQLQQRTEQLDEKLFMLRKQNEELKQLNRVVSHDLQEPLRKISMYTDLLQYKNEGPKLLTPQDSLLKLARAAEHMRAIVSGLQQFVWLQEAPLQLTTINLNNELSIITQQLHETFGHDKLIVEAEVLPAIQGDPEQLRLLLYQVLVNAIQFKKDDVPAFVRITGTVIQKNRFKGLKDEYRYEDYLKIAIHDQGIGFDPVFRDQVFELFKRLHKQIGKGLGLSVCKIIAENHKGTISADSIPGDGTTITVVLPVHSNL